jgi:hypothetical protein
MSSHHSRRLFIKEFPVTGGDSPDVFCITK